MGALFTAPPVRARKAVDQGGREQARKRSGGRRAGRNRRPPGAVDEVVLVEVLVELVARQRLVDRGERAQAARDQGDLDLRSHAARGALDDSLDAFADQRDELRSVGQAAPVEPVRP